jgi:hypothetical protein
VHNYVCRHKFFQVPVKAQTAECLVCPRYLKHTMDVMNAGGLTDLEHAALTTTAFNLTVVKKFFDTHTTVPVTSMMLRAVWAHSLSTSKFHVDGSAFGDPFQVLGLHQTCRADTEYVCRESNQVRHSSLAYERVPMHCAQVLLPAARVRHRGDLPSLRRLTR